MKTYAFDIEVFKNLYLALFKDLSTGEVLRFQLSPNCKLDIDGLRNILETHRVIGFNSKHYDIPLTQLALQGFTTQQIKQASDEIIVGNMPYMEFAERYCLERPTYNSIDLMPVAPLTGSLKAYAGRLHAQKLQDLPINPDAEVTAEQCRELYRYCVNDLDLTALLFEELSEQITLREQLSQEYGQDLRSRSDAQIAEAVISAEVAKINGSYPKRPVGLEGSCYGYRVPEYISYQSPQLNAMLETVREASFRVGPDGAVVMPDALANMAIKIGHGTYTMGIGGLHSCEKSVRYVADADTLLVDRDVASMYPNIILNQGLYPQHMGRAFLDVYQSIVTRRLAAKKAGNKVVAESLKIAANSGFGKLANKWSSLYSPDLMVQVTISGQLLLLMLIEMAELAGIEAISANTDGVVFRVKVRDYDTLQGVVSAWETLTGFTTEETRYQSYHAKDVNNYIAIKPDGKAKTKGAYSNPWSEPGKNIFRFHKNPTCTIATEAAINLLAHGTPIRETIQGSRDIRKFLAVRSVTGGAQKDGKYLGKTVRWYYSTKAKGAINYVTSGNKVPKSDGAKPLMDLPAEFPRDVDFSYYVAETLAILNDIGYLQMSLFSAA